MAKTRLMFTLKLHEGTTRAFQGLTRLDNIRIARVLGTLSNGTYPHSRPTSADTDHSAFVHIAITYPAITTPHSTCEVAKTCMVGETGTHTIGPPRPIHLTILPVALPTGSLLFHPIERTLPARAASGARIVSPLNTSTRPRR